MKRYIAVGLSAILCLAAFAAPATAKPLPDLLPTSAELLGEPFALNGNPVGARWRGTTTNRGRRAAGPSLTMIYLRHGDIAPYLFSSSIGKLKPRKTVKTNAASEARRSFKPGAYRLLVCADARRRVKESNEDNNCRYMQGRFYVSFEAWTGSVSGTSSASPYGPERWKSEDSSFHFTHYEHPGDFSYDQWTGSVDYTLHGTDEDGCLNDGHSVTSSGNGGLGLHYARERYFGFALLDAGYVTIQSNCNGTIDYHEQNQAFVFFDTSGPEAFGRDLGFGMTTLAGNVNDNEGTAYSWSLRGAKD